jgi:hypothetical protein
MRCIFCKEDTAGSISTEHIIPESLGNCEHILGPGIVCDKCNQYFGTHIEKPLLEEPWFVHARHRALIASKKGHIPPISGLHLQSCSLVEFGYHKGVRVIYPSRPEDSPRFVATITSRSGGTIIVPVPSDPEPRLLSCFLAKVAIEALAQRLQGVPRGIEEILQNDALEPLRRYARLGTTPSMWPFHTRTIYPEDQVLHEEGYGDYEVLHEYTFLYPSLPLSDSLYFVLALLGVEYAVNMDRPDTEEYEDWLATNSGASPLYPQAAA